jgi:hypothetical protein
LTVSGGTYELFGLHQIYQTVIYQKQTKFRFLIYEGLFASPDFKHRLALMKRHLDFEYEFVNFPWPGKTIYTDILPKRIINLVRIFFNENMFPLDVERVIYRDADQCTMTNTDL